MTEGRADAFLRMIRRSERGHLKVYLGYAAGVGKTYQMLEEAHRLKNEGIDVVIGLVETHGRAETAALIEGLEVIPRKQYEYRGIVVEETDVDGLMARKPQVAIIDELAHTNVPGSRNAKRYQDVQDVLAAGVHVITTLNVQHLESLYNVVEKDLGVAVRERLPDTVLANADQIVNVDISTQDLHKRLQEGRVYPEERLSAALQNFFKESNLGELRELTLRELAYQIDLRRRDTHEEEAGTAPDQVMVCLSSRGPNSESLLRYASRLAGRLSRNWYAVYVQTPSEEATVIDSQTQRMIGDTLTMAKQLGAIIFTYKGEDIVETILRFAKEYRVGHIILGAPRPKPLWRRLLPKENIVKRLIDEARGVNLVVVDTRTGQKKPAASRFASEYVAEGSSIAAHSTPEHIDSPPLSQLLTEKAVVFWDEPAQKDDILAALVQAACRGATEIDTKKALEAVLEREQRGSTFFNEGVALPHARMRGLHSTRLALGITRRGVADAPATKQIEYVLLALSPEETPDVQIRILGLVSRAFQSHFLLRLLNEAFDGEEVLAAIRNWELPQQGNEHKRPFEK